MYKSKFPFSLTISLHRYRYLHLHYPLWTESCRGVCVRGPPAHRDMLWPSKRSRVCGLEERLVKIDGPVDECCISRVSGTVLASIRHPLWQTADGFIRYFLALITLPSSQRRLLPKRSVFAQLWPQLAPPSTRTLATSWEISNKSLEGSGASSAVETRRQDTQETLQEFELTYLRNCSRYN